LAGETREHHPSTQQRGTRAETWTRIADAYAHLSESGRDRLVAILREYGVGHRDLSDRETAEASEIIGNLFREDKGPVKGETAALKPNVHRCPQMDLLYRVGGHLLTAPAFTEIEKNGECWYAFDGSVCGTRLFFCPFCGKDLDR
jgi:hypothetical protein